MRALVLLIITTFVAATGVVFEMPAGAATVPVVRPPGSAIAMARNADGRLELFGIATNGLTYHNWQTTAAGPWSG